MTYAAEEMPSPADEALCYQEQCEQDTLHYELGKRAFFPLVYGEGG
jgi:hypothetical protein